MMNIMKIKLILPLAIILNSQASFSFVGDSVDEIQPIEPTSGLIECAVSQGQIITETCSPVFECSPDAIRVLLGGKQPRLPKKGLVCIQTTIASPGVGDDPAVFDIYKVYCGETYLFDIDTSNYNVSEENQKKLKACKKVISYSAL